MLIVNDPNFLVLIKNIQKDLIAKQYLAYQNKLYDAATALGFVIESLEETLSTAKVTSLVKKGS